MRIMPLHGTGRRIPLVRKWRHPQDEAIDTPVHAPTFTIAPEASAPRGWCFASSVAGIFVGALGLLVLAGWLLDNEALARMVHGWPAMKVNTAAGFVLLGTALCLSRSGPPRGVARAVAHGGAFLASLVGLLSLAEYVAGTDVGIDTLLWTPRAVSPGFAFPHRMSLITAAAFLLAGPGILFLDRPSTGRAAASDVCASLILLAGMLGLLGPLYGIGAIDYHGRYSVMAVPTAAGFVVLGLGLLSARPERGLAALLRGRSPGSMLARRLLPAATLLPLILGWFRVEGQRAGFFHLAFGTAVFSMILVGLLAAVICWTAGALDRMDVQRARAESAREELALLPEQNPSPVFRVGRDGMLLYANAAGEVLLDGWRSRGNRTAPAPLRELIAGPLASGRPRDTELSVGPSTYLFSVAPVVARGYANLYALDLGERKRAEEALRRTEEELRRALQFDEAVMSSMGEGLYTVDARGLVTSLNPAAERLFGWTFAELRGRKMHEVTHYRRRDGTAFPADQCSGLRVLQEGRLLSEHEDVFLRKDGSFFDVVFSASPIREGGRITGLVVVFRDVSERNRIQAELRERESLLRTITDESRIGLVLVSRERRYLFANAAYADILRLPSADIVGKRVADVLAPVYDQIEPRLDRAFDGERVAYELRVPGPGGDHLYEVSYEPRGIGTERPFVVVGVVDITDRKRGEDELRRAHEMLADRAKHLESVVEHRTARLQETIGDLEAFSYSVSHDLRAPLRAMKGYAEILQGDEGPRLSEQGKDYLERIGEAAERMDRLIHDVLAYSRVVRAEFTLVRVDAAKVLRDILNGDPSLGAPRAKVEVEGPIPDVLGNEAALTQCLSNLLSNAVKFTAPGATPEVRIRAEELGDRVAIHVQDRGIGIEKEHQDRIFGLFQRLHHREYEGTGIGLAVVKKAAERMGGSIGLVSTPGVGSTFSLTLKRADA